MSARLGQVLAVLIALLVGMIFGLEVSGDAAAQPLAVASWTYDRPDHPATTASIQRERGPHAVQPADHRMGVISATLRGAASGHSLAQSASAIYNDSVMSVLVDGHVLLSPKSKRPDAVRRAGFGTEMQRGGVAADVGSTAGTIPGVLANQAAGNAFRDATASRLAAEGYEIVGTEVRVNTPFGVRVTDILAERNGALVGFETKLGSSRYLPSQRSKDIWISRFGGTLGDGSQIQFPTVLIRSGS